MKMQISADGGKTWKTVTGTVSIQRAPAQYPRIPGGLTLRLVDWEKRYWQHARQIDSKRAGKTSLAHSLPIDRCDCYVGGKN